MIGDDVEVTVLSSDGTKVRLGIEAPTRIPVFRMEIYLEIQQQRLTDPEDVGTEADDPTRERRGSQEGPSPR